MMLIGTRGYNFMETLFTTITVLLTVGMFAYVVSTIGDILDQINKFDKQNKIEMSLLNKYIKRKNISKRLRTHILDYLGYIHDQTEYF
jgi:hypothetical protein